MDQAPAGDPLVSGAAAAAAAAAAPEAPAVPSAAEGNITAPATASNPATTSTPAEAVNDPGATSFSWLDPHPEFVMILVGPNEVPFGLQTDFLRAKSSHYRKKLAGTDKFEAIERLPNCQFEVFALVQNFLYTGMVMPGDKTVPTYDILVGVWNQGHELGIDGLCDSTLDAMVEVRSATARIPAAPLLEQVWKTTPKGCSLRKLLLGWSAEYMRTSVSKAEFADSLPREVLSELVLVMVKSDTTPVVQLGGDSNHPNPTHPPRKQVHYLDQDEEEEPEPLYPVVKKPRRSEPSPHAPSASKAAVRKPRTSLPAPKPAPRRRSNATANGDQDFTTPQKLFFCSDLLTRMLSGPGFWTRLVGPFKEPVDATVDNVPDYFDKITKPMDLSTMKKKMDGNQYTSDEEFLADMNQIFTNCKTYWKPTDNVFAACEKLEKTFQEKYSQMNKWLAKIEGDEN